MNRFRSKFLDVFSLIKTSSKNRKIRKFLRSQVRRDGSGRPPGGWRRRPGNLTSIPGHLRANGRAGESGGKLGKGTYGRIGCIFNEFNGYVCISRIDMYMCMYVCIYIYVIYIHIYICGYIWINLITTPRRDGAGMMVGLGELSAKDVRPVNDFNLSR